MRISDWSSDVCSSDLRIKAQIIDLQPIERRVRRFCIDHRRARNIGEIAHAAQQSSCDTWRAPGAAGDFMRSIRSEEHTSELQSLMRISYAVFCLKKKNINTEQQCQSYNTQTINHNDV